MYTGFIKISLIEPCEKLLPFLVLHPSLFNLLVIALYPLPLAYSLNIILTISASSLFISSLDFLLLLFSVPSIGTKS